MPVLTTLVDFTLIGAYSPYLIFVNTSKGIGYTVGIANIRGGGFTIELINILYYGIVGGAILSLLCFLGTCCKKIGTRTYENGYG